MRTKRLNALSVRLAAGACLLMLTAGASWSQEARGTILGRVTDSQNAVVPNASVQIRNLGTGITTSVTSNEQGNYEAPFLLLGTYRITSEAQGFKRTVRDGIETGSSPASSR